MRTRHGPVLALSGFAPLLFVFSQALPLQDARPAGAGADTLRVRDDYGNEVALGEPARRIVSLVPAATEILFAIGAGDRLVGRARFDNHPPEALDVFSVGDGVRPSTEVILTREPDLVILFAGSDSRAAYDELQRLGVRVLGMANNTLPDLDRNVMRLGLLTGRETAADSLWAEVRAGLDRVRASTRGLPVRSVYYDAWWAPPITIGAGSYLDSLITIAGGRNVFGDLTSPSPQVSLEAIIARRPDLVLLPIHAEAPRVAPAERPGWSALPAATDDRVRAFDADLVVRLGPRTAEAARLLAAAIHPEVFVAEEEEEGGAVETGSRGGR